MVFTLDIKRNDSVDDNVVIIIHILIAIVNRISLKFRHELGQAGR
jgi:hypothetical protein